ncbi:MULTISPECIES: hypothetical protein [Sphingobacterium]|uniref:hypothetical protein n=1 Tax=Sphingobacterium TaxID=28453 RepID=UPI00257BF931|nr:MULTISPECIES: hypothetical protein [Sphingobacterium]
MNKEKLTIEQFHQLVTTVEENVDMLVIATKDNKCSATISFDNPMNLISKVIMEMHQNDALAMVITIAAEGYTNGPQPTEADLAIMRNCLIQNSN